MYKQVYRVGPKHRAFLAALSALQAKDEFDGKESNPGYLGVEFARIAACAELDAHVARRLTEGLTNHGLIIRHKAGAGATKSYYLMTQKGDDVILGDKKSVPA